MADPGFGLYVHWPFCQAKCPYCDFNSHVAASIDQDAWTEAYRKSIQDQAAITGGRRLNSIYFGGGTPSLASARVIESVISAAQSTWSFANDIEITLEANPTSIEVSRLTDYRSAGVNRVSVGIQALNDPDLKALGRLHSAKEAMAAFDVATSVFERSSFDLIYARQSQSLRDWEMELRTAIDLAGDHLSLYQLTIEPETAFGARHARGLLRNLPSEDLQADMYELTQDICEGAGLPAYEISNHARPGFESAHNKIYWSGGDWVGIGPGAHGRLTLDGVRKGTEAVSNPAAWLDRVARNVAVGDTHVISEKDTLEEYLMMGLRVRDGISLKRIDALNLSNKIKHLREIYMVETVDDRLRLSAQGRPVLNAVLRELLTG